MANVNGGYGFTYQPGAAQAPTQLFGWQVCLGHPETQSLEDADNYADYAINRDHIVQTLGLGMASGQNAFTLNGQMFVCAVSIQVEDRIQLIGADHPRYQDLSLVISEQLLLGNDHGMVAQLPNGKLVPFVPASDPSTL